MLYGEEDRLVVDKYVKLVDGAGGIEVLPLCGRLGTQATYVRRSVRVKVAEIVENTGL